MPLLHKTQGSIRQLERESVLVHHSGSPKVPEQAFVRISAEWLPVFAAGAQARWGYAAYAGPDLVENGYLGPQSFIDENLTVFMATDDGETLTYDLPDGDTFAYFAHPASLGKAVFTDTSNGFQGSWDGAGWLDDYSMEGDGPIEVTFDDGSGPALWYVYRTDWEGPSTAPTTFKIDYPNRA